LICGLIFEQFGSRSEKPQKLGAEANV